MRSFDLRRFPSRLATRLTAVLVLVTMICAHVPVPVITRVSPDQKDRSKPFPCQDRPCGCRSAEQCKKKCCCYTSQQKLAWAKKNGVRAEEVVAVASKPASSTPLTKTACCLTGTSSKTKDRHSSTPSSSRQIRTKFVVGIVALGCHGVDQSAIGQMIFVVPPDVSITLVAEPTGERSFVVPDQWTAPETEPPVPPPRLFVGVATA